MCSYFGWGGADNERQIARQRFRAAMVIAFNDHYGTDIDDINSWHKLCRVLNIAPVPRDVASCKAVSALPIRFCFAIVNMPNVLAGHPTSPREPGRSGGHSPYRRARSCFRHSRGTPRVHSPLAEVLPSRLCACWRSVEVFASRNSDTISRMYYFRSQMEGKGGAGRRAESGYFSD